MLWSSGSSIVVLLVVCVTTALAIVQERYGSNHGSNAVQSSRFLYPEDEVKPCLTDLNLPGRCVDVRLCYAARIAVRTGNHPVRCGWTGRFVPKVCCHPDQVQRAKLVFVSNRFRRRNDTEEE